MAKLEDTEISIKEVPEVRKSLTKASEVLKVSDEMAGMLEKGLIVAGKSKVTLQKARVKNLLRKYYKVRGKVE